MDKFDSIESSIIIYIFHSTPENLAPLTTIIYSIYIVFMQQNNHCLVTAGNLRINFLNCFENLYSSI